MHLFNLWNNIYENGKAVFLLSHILITNFFQKWFKIFEICLFENFLYMVYHLFTISISFVGH